MRTGAPLRFTGHVRVWKTLRDQGPMEVKQLAKAACLSIKRVRECITDLHECGLIHVAGWRPVTVCGGHPAKVWAFGHKADAPKPPAKDVIEIRLAGYHRRKQEWINQFGLDVWRRVSKSRAKGGPDRIVIDGRCIYQRASTQRSKA